jgi:iron complex transport system permease protein
MLVIGISRVSGAVDAAGMLLAGVAVAAILGALRSFLMLALSDETVSLQIVLSWVLGGVQTPSWPVLGLLAVISAACLALTMALAGRLDVLGLGETMATAFGLNVHRFIAFAVLAGSVVVAAAVAFGGLVAFVGLASPHIARWLVGPLHRPLLPASALVGAIVVTLADAIARAALPPAEIPLGLVTAIAGGPFFILQARGQAQRRAAARRAIAVAGIDGLGRRDRSERSGQVDPAEGARRHREADVGDGPHRRS